HQFYNAKAFADAGAALLLDQRTATGAQLADAVTRLLQDKSDEMRHRLKPLHAPHAAELIADKIILMMEARAPRKTPKTRGETPQGSLIHHPEAAAEFAK